MSKYGFCNLSLVPLRAQASDKSEMLSQLVFGDSFEILEHTEKWVRIKNWFDDYEGWIDHKQFQVIEEDEFEPLTKNYQTTGPVAFQGIRNETTKELLHLISGSTIPFLESRNFRIGDQHFSFEAEPILGRNEGFENLVITYSRFFLNTPYLWGGKSLLGIDCSGFTQVVFKMLGIQIKRDAWQQAEQGTTVDFLQEVKPGDLAFFDNAEGRIIHVGIMMNEHQIIHASGRVKIDPIDDQGIYSLDLKKHTHKLRIIKRYTAN